MKKSPNAVGKFLRVYRIEKNMIAADMASRLGISESYICVLELGKKNFPDALAQKIPLEFGFSETETKAFMEAVALSKTEVLFNLSEVPEGTARFILDLKSLLDAGALDRKTVRKLNTELKLGEFVG